MLASASDNATLELLSNMLAMYNVQTHSGQVPSHIQAIVNILSNAGLGSGSNLSSGSSITAGHLHSREDVDGGTGEDGGVHGENFGFFDTDTAAFYYDEDDLEQLRKPWVKVTYFIPLVMIYGVIFLTGW